MYKNFLGLLLSVSIVGGFSAQAVMATCGGGGGGGVGGLNSAQTYVVPWQHIVPEPPAKEGIVIFWLPNSNAEFENSSLRYSRMLSLYAGHCVSLYALSTDSKARAKFVSGDAAPPVVVLTNADGTVIDKIDATTVPVRVRQVEQLLRAEIDKRRIALQTKMDGAAAKADGGDKDGAIQDYRDILKQRCMFPKLAEQAAQKLQDLGVTDVSKLPDGGPDFRQTTSTQMERLMADGLKEESHDNYDAALKLYTEAHKLDPEDPTPLRYIGELYRHEIGDWDKAKQTFEQILAMPADPLSRAVALHGLGKMTIHNGDFKKGLHLMEQSVKVYPLPIACRNLAVYWNSEGDFAKSEKYINQALQLDPNDKFNLVFAAVFMAANGHTQEALKIAKENEDLMPASYNLAAIYAQSGNKEKALELLRRHFFTYERNESVRSKEMMEARVDRVFASLMKDKDFLALTSGADGKLPMRNMP